MLHAFATKNRKKRGTNTRAQKDTKNGTTLHVSPEARPFSLARCIKMDPTVYVFDPPPPSWMWTRHRAVKQGKSGGSVGTTDQGKGKGSWEGKSGQEGTGGSLRDWKFFLLRTALRDHQPPTANCHQTPTANRCQLPSATNHQPPTAANHHQPPATKRQSPPTMVEFMSYTRSFCKTAVQELFFPFLKDRPEEEGEGHRVMRGRWASLPMEGKGPREGPCIATGQ